MKTALFDKPLMIDPTPLPHSQQRPIDLKLAHVQAGLDPRDVQFLDAVPVTARPRAQTFRGVSIE